MTRYPASAMPRSRAASLSGCCVNHHRSPQRRAGSCTRNRLCARRSVPAGESGLPAHRHADATTGFALQVSSRISWCGRTAAGGGSVGACVTCSPPDGGGEGPRLRWARLPPRRAWPRAERVFTTARAGRALSRGDGFGFAPRHPHRLATGLLGRWFHQRHHQRHRLHLDDPLRLAYVHRSISLRFCSSSRSVPVGSRGLRSPAPGVSGSGGCAACLARSR